MSLIFQSENSVPSLVLRPVDQTTGPVVDQPKRTHQQSRANKNSNHKNGQKNKSSVSNNKHSLPAKLHSKIGVGSSSNRVRSSETLEDVTGQPVLSSSSWKSGLNSGVKRNQINHSSGQRKKQREEQLSRQKAVHHLHHHRQQQQQQQQPEKESPLELWKLIDDNNNNNSDQVLTKIDFDSYLAETEEMLAHPAEVIDQLTTSTSTTPLQQRSSFIHRESGGWEEVIVSRPVDSDSLVVPVPPTVLQEEDEDLIA